MLGAALPSPAFTAHIYQSVTIFFLAVP
jgi:hypothetical protein